jgi:hypothetical protein
MSLLIYDGHRKTLTLLDRDQKPVGIWPANNRVTQSVVAEYNLTGLPNGDYVVQDQNYPSHDGPGANYKSNASVGPAGMIKLKPFTVNGQKHEDAGIHAGRKGVPDQSPAAGKGIDHVTHLCVRTTDVAMSMIKLTIREDPLKVLNVRGNDHVKGRPLAFHK